MTLPVLNPGKLGSEDLKILLRQFQLKKTQMKQKKKEKNPSNFFNSLMKLTPLG